MGKMKEIAIETEGNLCYYCKTKIRARGSERKNGREKPNLPDREQRWFHAKCMKAKCMKDRKHYYDLKERLNQENQRGLPMYF